MVCCCGMNQCLTLQRLTRSFFVNIIRPSSVPLSSRGISGAASWPLFKIKNGHPPSRRTARISRGGSSKKASIMSTRGERWMWRVYNTIYYYYFCIRRMNENETEAETMYCVMNRGDFRMTMSWWTVYFISLQRVDYRFQRQYADCHVVTWFKVISKGIGIVPEWDPVVDQRCEKFPWNRYRLARPFTRFLPWHSIVT